MWPSGREKPHSENPDYQELRSSPVFPRFRSQRDAFPLTLAPRIAPPPRARRAHRRIAL